MKQIRLRLDELLNERHMSLYALSKKIDVDYSVLIRYRKNRVVRYDSSILLKICQQLPCGIEELIHIE